MKLSAKIISIIVTFELIIIAFVWFITGNMLSKNIMKTSEREVISYANTIAKVLDDVIGGDELRHYTETLETDDYYYVVKEKLQELKTCNTNVKYMYVFAPQEDGSAIYIMDIFTKAEYDSGEADDEGELGFVEENARLGYADKIYKNNRGYNEITVDDCEYGYVMSAYAPIFGEDGKVKAIIGVDYDMNDIDTYVAKFLFSIVIMVAIVTIICTVLLIRYMRSHVVAPLSEVSDKVKRYAASDHSGDTSEHKVYVKTRDEIRELADSFNLMVDDIDSYIKNIANISAEKERIGVELNVATRIQADMLPKIFLEAKADTSYAIHASMDPAKEVGGDFYDFFVVDDDHILIVIADVSGKGVPAALFMVVAKTLIKNYGISGKSPADIFYCANNQLCEGNDEELFVTAWLGIIELSTGRLQYTDAGHENPIVIKKNGSADFLTVPKKKMPLGAWDGMEYDDYETYLEHGDMILLYTDGVPEATNANKELFGIERLIRATKRYGKSKNPKNLLKGIREDVDEFVGNAEQFDDLTMLGFYYK